MIEATSIGSGKRVLDIGCGAGHSSALIKATGATIVGVDAAQGMVDYAKKTFDGIDFQVGGIEELAFSDDEFDVVFAANSVQYAADLDTALTELNRVCKPGGSIVAGLFGPPEAISYGPSLELWASSCPNRRRALSPVVRFGCLRPACSKPASPRLGSMCREQAKSTARSSTTVGIIFWRGTRAAGPTQMAIGLAGLDAVEQATRKAVEPLIAKDGRISFDPNVFVYVVGQA